ncbi:hypothetical protein M0R45_019951 [Rubus argutus]|uniref:Cytochrome P450 CYP749A22-like n=1 Tax=Rubus argutus TaxID=59490 RepID=A0AAW1X7T8_RUBAR
MMSLVGDTVLTLPSFLYSSMETTKKLISNMLKEARSRPIRNLSHDILSAVQPHIHSWTKSYGMNFLQWSKLRKLSNHAFHGDNLKSMIPDMIASSEMMLEGWKKNDGKEIEVYEQFRLCTSEVISRTAFGSCYLEGKNIFDMLLKLSSVIVRNSHKLRVPGIIKVYKTTTGVIFLECFLKAHHGANDKQRISVNELVEECKTFYFAGQDTTNSLLVWTVFLLALHMDWQEEARKEVLQLFGKETPNPDGLAKLKTMSMIINESLRLYPPIISLTRKVDKEVRLENLIVPTNVELLVPNLALHHEPQFWGQDVKRFKPERFSEGVANATNNNMAAFLPFGMGSRTCVGFNFATIEAKIALLMILQRYSFTLSPDYVHSPFQIITVRPQHGLQIILHSL